MSFLIPKDHDVAHPGNFGDVHPLPLNDFYSRLFMDFAFTPEEEPSSNRRRRLGLRGRNISKSVAQSIGLERLPLAQDSAIYSIKGKLAEIFADDNRSGADIVREIRDVDE